jgi:iron complex outermembrane receptor protein
LVSFSSRANRCPCTRATRHRFKPQIFYADPEGDLPKPEVGKQIEIGWKQEWQNATASAALFEIRKRNVSTEDPNNPARTIQTGEQRSRGVEFEVQGRLLPTLQLSAALALLDAEVTSDETIPEGDGLLNAPTEQANVWLKYTPQGEFGWFLGGGALYTSKREASMPNNGVEIPAGTRLDAVTGYRSSQWKAQLNARNLTDEKLYTAWSSGFVIPQAGRSFSAQVEFSW